MRSKTTETTHLGVRIPFELADAVRRRAVEEERTVSQVVRRALKAHLADPGPDVRIRPGGDARGFEAVR